MGNKNVDSHHCPLYTKAKRVVLLRKKKKKGVDPLLKYHFPITLEGYQDIVLLSIHLFGNV